MANVTGGKKFAAWVKRAKRNARRAGATEVGFFPGQRYEDGAEVADVAILHEFGLGDLPERAFFRRATETAKPAVRRALRAELKGNALEHPFDIPPEVGREAGQELADEIRRSVEDWRDPSGEAALYDTGKLARSVEVRDARAPDVPATD